MTAPNSSPVQGVNLPGSPAKKRLILVIQEKGGVGKTFLTVHLTTYLKALGASVRPVDFDYEEGVLTDVFPHPESLNVSPDSVQLLARQSQLPQLMKRAIDGERFILDCGANTGGVWERLLFDVWPDLPTELEKAGVGITLVVPIDSVKKSRRAFDSYRQLFPQAATALILVREAKNIAVPLPESKADITIDLEMAPKALFEAYKTRALPMDELAKIKATGDPVPSMARAYLPKLHDQFSKFKHLLV